MRVGRTPICLRSGESEAFKNGVVSRSKCPRPQNENGRKIFESDMEEIIKVLRLILKEAEVGAWKILKHWC